MGLSYVSYGGKHKYLDKQNRLRRSPGRLRRRIARHNFKSLLELPGFPGGVPKSHVQGLSLADLVSQQESANGNFGNGYLTRTNEVLDRFGIDNRLGFLSQFNGDAHYGATLVRRTYDMIRHYGLTNPSPNDKDIFTAVMSSLHQDGEFVTKTLIEFEGIDNLPKAVRNGMGYKLRLFQKELYGLMSRLIH